MLPDLTDFIYIGDGEISPVLPVTGNLLSIRQDEMHDHPFIVAQEVFVFAGPDAQRAHDNYIQDRDVRLDLNVVLFRIEETVLGDDGIGTMTVRREL